jgi:hypothetical protein
MKLLDLLLHPTQCDRCGKWFPKTKLNTRVTLCCEVKRTEKNNPMYTTREGYGSNGKRITRHWRLRWPFRPFLYLD